MQSSVPLPISTPRAASRISPTSPPVSTRSATPFFSTVSIIRNASAIFAPPSAEHARVLRALPSAPRSRSIPSRTACPSPRAAHAQSRTGTADRGAPPQMRRTRTDPPSGASFAHHLRSRLLLVASGFSLHFKERLLLRAEAHVVHAGESRRLSVRGWLPAPPGRRRPPPSAPPGPAARASTRACGSGAVEVLIFDVAALMRQQDELRAPVLRKLPHGGHAGLRCASCTLQSRPRPGPQAD